MNYALKWMPLRARISGLVQAGHLHAAFLNVRVDSFNRGSRLREQCAVLLDELQTFRSDFGPSLPFGAAKCIEEFVERTSPYVRNAQGRDLDEEATWFCLVAFAALESELSFLLSNTQEVLRTQSERAFVHLQRLIVVDSDIQSKWSNAFEEGETKCEKLGAVHLLSHGLFAFKVSEAGERTDLVFQDRIQDLDAVQRYADGLVLTEWKVAKPDNTASKRLQEARRQANRYRQGVLGGTELANYRYAVVVSQDRVPGLAPEVMDGDIRYRQINIAIKPSVPSVASRR